MLSVSIILVVRLAPEYLSMFCVTDKDTETSFLGPRPGHS